MKLLLIACMALLTPLTGTETTAEEQRAISRYEIQYKGDSEVEPADTLKYYGNCRITFYCPCAKCCGKDDGITASGAPAQVNHTVANGSLPFGARVQIDGVTYTVEDRGVGSDQFDIFVAGHQEAYDRGLYYTDVYLVG